MQLFSDTLAAWLKGTTTKTVGGLLHVFGEKSFAFLFLVLMIFPAAPIPTGGLVHVFEVVVMLVALQLVAGRNELWLPDRLAKAKLSSSMQKSVLPFLLKRVRQAEKISKPRLSSMLKKGWFKSQLGLVVIIFTAGAFFAPPFTGLDTLPSLGVVFIALGVILEDFLVVLIGYIIGLAGLVLAVMLGAGIITAISHFF